ncbi:hypothetical protein BSKO_01099 [Bryopsis sp. KO-2023]|nr:hypothetical protein BSKO_01099 [Bryopsis sp. KO-2023]
MTVFAGALGLDAIPSCNRTVERCQRNACGASADVRSGMGAFVRAPLASASLSRGRRFAMRAVSDQGFPSEGQSAQSAVDRRDFLLNYVRDVEPEVMEEFVNSAPSQVIEAMRHTITNMLGSLPPQFFDVRISTMGENLSQLMYSVMMTGYMFKNAQYRLDLTRNLGALPAPEDMPERDSNYISTAQTTRVQGEVVRWHNDLGAESMSAVQYIEQLESELNLLRNQLEQKTASSCQYNNLLDYIKKLDAQTLQELTAFAEEDVLLAMNVFIQRMMGTSDVAELRQTNCESTALELARLLYWLMVVGYNLRGMEVRFDMEETFTLPEISSGNS